MVRDRFTFALMTASVSSHPLSSRPARAYTVW